MAELTGKILYNISMKVLEKQYGLKNIPYRYESWDHIHQGVRDHFNQTAADVTDHINKPEEYKEGDLIIFPGETVH